MRDFPTSDAGTREYTYVLVRTYFAVNRETIRANRLDEEHVCAPEMSSRSG